MNAQKRAELMSGIDDIGSEFDALLRRSGLVFPPERLPVLRRCYAEIRSWGEIIRQWDLVPSQESANIFDIRTITRCDGPDGSG